MAAALLLDLLIFLVPVMLIPLGLWRGGPHEVVVGGGILLGWAVSTEWAGAWGGGLASLTGTPADAMSFVVACGLLVVGAAIGHLGGTLIGLPRPEADGRIAGAVLAWLNGVLFLTLALGIYGRQLDGAEPMPLIERGFLTRAIIDHQGALLLGIALVVGGLVATVLWVNAAVGNVYDPTYVPGRRTAFTANPDARPAREEQGVPASPAYSTWPTAPRQRPINVPHHADAGKVEPEVEQSRFRTALSRIGPASGGEPSRRTTIAEMFAQSLPVDLRDRVGRATSSDHSTDELGGGSAADQRDGSRMRPDGPATPRRGAGARPAAPRPTPGPAATRARQARGDTPPPAQSPIGEWLRVASGMSNPLISPARDGHAARRPERDGELAGDGADPNGAGAPDEPVGRATPESDGQDEVDDATPRRA